jgi:hypothetical protein
LVVLYGAAVVFLYSGLLSPLGPLFSQRISQIYQATWIPITLYLLVPVFLALGYAGALVGKRPSGK